MPALEVRAPASTTSAEVGASAHPDTQGMNVHIVGGAQLPAALGAKPAAQSLSVVPAQAAAPTWGQKTAPTGTATALASSATYALSLTIYPDPSIDVFVASTAITTTTGAATFPLRAGGPPLVLQGPIDPSTIFVLAASGSPVVGFVGQ